MALGVDDGGETPVIEEHDVLYDDRLDEHYVAVAITEDGVTLRRRDTEYYIPHTIFAEWYDPDRITRTDHVPAEAPEWIEPEESSS